MARRKRLIGVDFSGARDAGNHIWIAAATADGRGVALEDCRPAREFAGGRADREAALAALVGLLADDADSVAGLDFPFSLPAPLVPDPTWTEFVAAFPARYPDAEAFRAACRTATGGREIKRRTDVEARVPFSVFNLRLYRQTHAGIARVLNPLVAGGRARVVPMQRSEPGKAVIAEICPASLLKAAGLYGPYKGRGGRARDARRSLLAALAAAGLIRVRSRRLRARMIEDEGGDALDAALAALGAARLDGAGSGPADPLEAIEGRVYF